MNFNTKNLIIVCFPNNAGGRFLINSLGLSNDAVLQDKFLAQQQLDLNFNQQDKFNLLEARISEVVGSWNDLYLSCSGFFGVKNKDYILSPELVRDYGKFNKIACDISNLDKKFFIAGHWPEVINRYFTVWPNASIIMFENFTNFINFRMNDLTSDRDQILYQNKIEESYKEQTSHINNIIYKWDTNRYFDEDQTINGIRELYNILNLGSFNEDLLRRYHNLWISKLDELAHRTKLYGKHFPLEP